MTPGHDNGESAGFGFILITSVRDLDCLVALVPHEVRRPDVSLVATSKEQRHPDWIPGITVTVVLKGDVCWTKAVAITFNEEDELDRSAHVGCPVGHGNCVRMRHCLRRWWKALIEDDKPLSPHVHEIRSVSRATGTVISQLAQIDPSWNQPRSSAKGRRFTLLALFGFPVLDPLDPGNIDLSDPKHGVSRLSVGALEVQPVAIHDVLVGPN
jgi:hypothetical protein